MSGFSLINSNLLMYQLPRFCFKTPCTSWFLPCLSGAVPQGCLRGCLWGLSSQQVRRIKHKQLLGCAFFFFFFQSIGVPSYLSCQTVMVPEAGLCLTHLAVPHSPASQIPGHGQIALASPGHLLKIQIHLLLDYLHQGNWGGAGRSAF